MRKTVKHAYTQSDGKRDRRTHRGKDTQVHKESETDRQTHSHKHREREGCVRRTHMKKETERQINT